MKAKKILARIGVNDFLLPIEELEKFEGYIIAENNEGKILSEPNSFFINFEDENGVVCDENGNYDEEIRSSCGVDIPTYENVRKQGTFTMNYKIDNLPIFEYMGKYYKLNKVKKTIEEFPKS